MMSATTIATAAAISPPAAQLAAAAIPAHCRNSDDPVARAAELLANRYLLPPHPIVRLPADPSWAENPLHDRNWQFQFHSLRYVSDLLEAASLTGNTAYRSRAIFLLHAWYDDNPRYGAPSSWSWNDHTTAWRAMVYACAAEMRVSAPWLRDALVLHGRTLADPDFYRWHGNHALNQALGLLEVGRVLGRSDWMDLARRRLNALVVESVDTQGVTNEQAIQYQAYNYNRYRAAEQRLHAAGLTAGSGFARVALMPRLLAEATLPNGLQEQIGDSEGTRRTGVIAGTWAEFVSTRGSSGPMPPLVAAYGAGYLFAHSGWGTGRSWPDETFLSLRWGPGVRFHGHPDGTALTLYAWGSRLLVDPGKYSYNPGAWRSYFTSRAAHNVVTVDGLAWRPSEGTALLGRTNTPSLVDVRMRTLGYSGVTHLRRVTWSRHMDYLLVDDRLLSSTTHTYRQLWHFVEHPNLAVGSTTVRTQLTHGNVLVKQLTGSPTLRVITGATSPIQGWISYSWGTKVAAPVVQAIRRGTNVRYLTLIVPSAGQPAVSVSGLRLTADGYAVTVTFAGRSERVVATGSSVSITPVAG